METSVRRRAVAVGVAAYLAVAGLIASTLGAVLIVDLTGATTVAERQVASSAGLGLGAVTATYFFVRWTDRDWSFVDVGVPDRRDLAVLAGGALAVVGVFVGLAVLYGVLGVETTSHGVVDELRGGDRVLLAAAIATSVLVVGPAEELLYRNVVQKYLYGAFARPAAVVVASAAFAGIHLPAYLTPGATATAVLATLAVVFALAVVLGAAYAVTENVVVPAVLHGLYNAVTFASVILGS